MFVGFNGNTTGAHTPKTLKHNATEEPSDAASSAPKGDFSKLGALRGVALSDPLAFRVKPQVLPALAIASARQELTPSVQSTQT